LHTVCDTGEHGLTVSEDHVSVQIATDVEVALEDGIIPEGWKRASDARNLNNVRLSPQGLTEHLPLVTNDKFW
jgi:hypothetical protein